MVTLYAANDDSVKGVQADILFDPAMVEFTSAAAAGRASGMTCSAAVRRTGAARVVLFYDGADVLPQGVGPIANLTFRLLGAVGAHTALTPDSLVLSNPAGRSLPVTGQGATLSITDLRLFVLKNPARTRILQVFVGADSSMASPPTLTGSVCATAGEAKVRPCEKCAEN